MAVATADARQAAGVAANAGALHARHVVRRTVRDADREVVRVCVQRLPGEVGRRYIARLGADRENTNMTWIEPE
jgi:hypothetical protein